MLVRVVAARDTDVDGRVPEPLATLVDGTVGNIRTRVAVPLVLVLVELEGGGGVPLIPIRTGELAPPPRSLNADVLNRGGLAGGVATDAARVGVVGIEGATSRTVFRVTAAIVASSTSFKARLRTKKCVGSGT